MAGIYESFPGTTHTGSKRSNQCQAGDKTAPSRYRKMPDSTHKQNSPNITFLKFCRACHDNIPYLIFVGGDCTPDAYSLRRFRKENVRPKNGDLGPHFVTTTGYHSERAQCTAYSPTTFLRHWKRTHGTSMSASSTRTKPLSSFLLMFVCVRDQ